MGYAYQKLTKTTISKTKVNGTGKKRVGKANGKRKRVRKTKRA